ncbi:MAG: sugar ABC transporter substrate-binding protein [Gemmatimonadetes bacterium]|nr:sugar ABC transporter substrate-binding protein [Gemmatimonadota bacterium]
MAPSLEDRRFAAVLHLVPDLGEPRPRIAVGSLHGHDVPSFPSPGYRLLYRLIVHIYQASVKWSARKPLAAAGILLASAACGSEAGGDGVTIEFWGMGREGEVVAALVPEFERRHPGIEVQVQQIPWTAAHEKLVTAYVGDATPDVAQLGNTWIPEFAALEALAPLGERVARSAAIGPEEYFAGIWETNVVDGTVYGIPWYVDTRVLFYRKDLLAAAGYAEPPETWAEWLEAMRRLEAVMGDDGYPILLPTNEWPQPVILALQAGSTLLDEGDRYGAFAAPEFREAFTFYVEIFRRGYAPPLANTQIANLYQQFADGEFAMVITGPWNIGEFRARLPEDLQDDWGTAPLPGPKGPGVSMAGGASFVIFESSEHSEHADAAWELIEYLSEPAVQVRFYELSGDLPARRAAWDDPALANDPQVQAFRAQLDRVVPLPRVPEWEQIATRVYEYGEAAVRGSMTIDQALTALDRDVDRMLEKRRWMLAQREEEGKSP